MAYDIYIWSTKKLVNEKVQCMGKIRYPSENVAWYVYYKYLLKAPVYTRFIPPGKEIDCYHCKYCKSWHLGRSIKTRSS